MVHRRTFLKLAGGAAGALYVGPAFASRPQGLHFDRVLVDDRFAESAAFARAAGPLAARTALAPRGDITALWYDELQRDWEHAPRAIAGLTGPEPLFCLQTLARDHGLRVVMAVRHADGAPAGRPDWVAGMVGDASRALRDRRAPVQHATGRPAELVTWVIAPAAKTV